MDQTDICERFELLGPELTRSSILSHHPELWLNNNPVRSPRLRLENYTSAFDYVFRIVLVGESKVGKTALTRRIAYKVFHRDPPVTVGKDCRERIVHLKEKVVKVELWDTAGAESSRSIFPSYFHSADAVVIVYDLTDRKSFMKLSKWIGLAQKYSEKNTRVFIIGTKHDILKCRAMSHEEIKTFVALSNLQAFEASALTGFGVEEALTTIVMTLQRIEVKKQNKNRNLTELEEARPTAVSTKASRRSRWCVNICRICRILRIARKWASVPSISSEESQKGDTALPL